MNTLDSTFAPKRCTQEAFDADEHAQNLTRWQQEYDQLSPGSFYGRLDEVDRDSHDTTWHADQWPSA